MMVAEDFAGSSGTVDFLQRDDIGIELFRVALEGPEVERRAFEFLRDVAGNGSLTRARRGIAGNAGVGKLAEFFGGDEPLEVPGGDAQRLICRGGHGTCQSCECGDEGEDDVAHGPFSPRQPTMRKPRTVIM